VSMCLPPSKKGNAPMDRHPVRNKVA
jgi:hypothetical protein